MKTKMWYVLATFLLLCTVSSYSATYMQQETHTDEMKMMGQTQPARTDTVTTWVEDDRAVMITPKEKVLYLNADNKMYVINDAAKTYMEVPMDMLGDMMSAGGSLEDKMAAAGKHMTPEQKEKMEAAMKQLEGNPQAKEMAEKMMGQMMGGTDEKGEPVLKATVTKTGESETINGYEADKYIVDMKMQMGEGTQEIWATPELEMNQSMYQMMKSLMLSRQDGFDEFLAEMEKIKGVPVKTSATIKIMGSEVTTTSRLLDYAADKDAPAGMFELPEGYTKQDMMGMGGH